MAIPVDELQKNNPSSIIELFIVQLDNSLHGATTSYRFHAGVNELNDNIIWQGNQYTKFPIKADGFEFTGTGQLPRPTLTVSNVLNTITALMSSVNQVTAGNDLNGAKFTRIRTHAKFLDNANFTSGSNPYGTPSNTEHPREIYFIDRKISENREAVVFELVSKQVLDNLRIPRRQVTRKLFPAVGQFMS